jgi:hypothetical protein
MTLYFPVLPGQSWSVHKRPTFSTKVTSHVSGREVRTALYAYPLYEFELTFDGLDEKGDFVGLKPNSLQTLMDFYISCQGQFGTFLYTDLTDYSVTGQQFATGDGVTTTFKLGRSLITGGSVEPVSWSNSVANVKVNGAATSAYTLAAPNLISFTTAPGNGYSIVADITYSFLCRFVDDSNDFENWMSGLWKVDSLKFRSVKV